MNKMKKYMLSVIGEHFLNIAVSLGLICVAGAAFQSKTWLVSILTAIVYLSTQYSSGWKNSGKDYRLVNAKVAQAEAEGLTYKIYDGFIHAMPLLILSALFLISSYLFGDIGTIVYRFYNLAFLFLFDKIKVPHLAEICALILPYLAYSVGYVIGKSKKTFISQHIGKLIYKSKKSTEKTKR